MRIVSRHLMKFLCAILPTLIMFYVLIELFPYTGLGRIVALPSILFINAAIVLVGILLTKKINHRWHTLVWIGIVFFTLAIAVALYPQESRPHVAKQAWNGISAIQDYNKITSDVLDLRSSKRDTINPREKYVVALYKFRNEIPMDGSYHIYQEESSYFFDSTIRSIHDIPKKLEGYHKVMWWYLSHSLF